MKHTITKISTILAGVCCASSLLSAPVLANDQPAAGGQDVYRLYNQNTGEHFYTQKTDEKAALIKAGWTYEGIGWTAAKTGDPVYRLYNPNADGGDHYYTKDLNEANSLVSLGWSMDNDGQPVFYSGGEVSLYSAYNPNAKSGAHNYTTSRTEQDALMKAGWLYDQVAWNVLEEGHEDIDASLFERFAGQEFVNNTWGAAGGPGITMTINADGTYRETNARISSNADIGSDYSEFTGKLSDPVKVDDSTWKVQVLSSDLVMPVNTILNDGNIDSKIMIEPFAGFYAPMEFYIGAPGKPLQEYPAFIQERYSMDPDTFKTIFTDSWILYTTDGTTSMRIKK